MTDKRARKILMIIVGCVFVLCTIIGLIFPRLIKSDGKIFLDWGDWILENGAGSFLKKINTDYPPITLAIIIAQAWFARITHMPRFLEYYMFSIIPTLALCAGTVLFYLVLRHFNVDYKRSLWLTAAYGFMPAMLFNIAIIQFDTVLAMFVLLAVLLYLKQRYFWVMLVSGIAILTKLHFAYFVFPLLFVAVVYQMHKRGKILHLIALLAGIGLAGLCVYIPFMWNEIKHGNVFYIFYAVTKPLIKRNIFSMNAFNTMFIANLFNWHRYTHYMFWYSIVNLIIFALITAFSIFLFLKSPSDKNLLLLLAFNIIALFMITTSMYDRYTIPALGLLLIASSVIVDRRLSFITWFFYIQTASSIVINPIKHAPPDGLATYLIAGSFIGLLSTLAFIYFVYLTLRLTRTPEVSK